MSENYRLDHDRYEQLRAGVRSLDYKIVRWDITELHGDNKATYPELVLRLEQQPVGTNTESKDTLEDVAMRIWAFFTEQHELHRDEWKEGEIVKRLTTLLQGSVVVI